MHAWRYPEHERRVALLAREMGFPQVSASHEVSPLIKLVGRGDTTVVDAYLSPILRRYVDEVDGRSLAGREQTPSPRIHVHAVLRRSDRRPSSSRARTRSSPALPAAWSPPSRRRALAGFGKVIGFDMGGTSTDVSHFDGDYERAFETEVAGVRMRAPMMRIHTVAAGGGSILHYDQGRYQVGPQSAGADPGPACYRRGGPLAVTDANVMVGKLVPGILPDDLRPEPRPAPRRRRPSAPASARSPPRSATAARRRRSPTASSASPSKTWPTPSRRSRCQRGYDVTEYALNCFGGAGGQHACLVADTLGMKTVLIHPFSGVLSAYGMGLADIRATRNRAVMQTRRSRARGLAGWQPRRWKPSGRASLQLRASTASDIDDLHPCPSPLRGHRHADSDHDP